METIQVIVLVVAGIIGAIFGSFACCQAWRIHEKSSGKKLGKWSECMDCGARLKWYDNLPIISWILLRGKCRKCHKKIGLSEFLSEVLMAAAFVLIVAFYMPISVEDQIMTFDGWAVLAMVPVLIFMIPLAIMAVYDAKWGELPVSMLTLSNILGVITFGVHEFIKLMGPCTRYGFYASKTVCYAELSEGAKWETLGGDLLSLLIAIGILAGIYFAIYMISKEKMVGGGDYILAAAIAVALGSWPLAIMELFLSNFSASIVMLPKSFKKENRGKPFPFGPYLIISFVVVFVLQNVIRRMFIF